MSSMIRLRNVCKNYQLGEEIVPAVCEVNLDIKEKEYKELQRKYFGREGDLFKKRQGLVKPIQDDIFNAIQEISTEGSYAIIFDKSSGVTLIYTNPKFDLSDQVLTKLGYKN